MYQPGYRLSPMETLRHAGQTRTWSKPGTSQAGRRWITRGRIDRAVSAHAQAFATRLTRHGLALSSPAPSLARWARRQMSLATMGSKLPGSSFRNVTPSESVKAPSLATRHPSRRPLGPVGSGRAQTLPRWLLPATDCRIAKDRMGLIWPSGPSILLCTEPGNSCGKSKTSCVPVSRSEIGSGS